MSNKPLTKTEMTAWIKDTWKDATADRPLFPPGGPYAPHRCAICNGRFLEGQLFYNYGQGQVVHSKCLFHGKANK